MTDDEPRRLSDARLEDLLVPKPDHEAGGVGADADADDAGPDAEEAGLSDD